MLLHYLGKPKQATCTLKWTKKNFNKFNIFGPVSPNSQLITRFDCRAVLCRPDDLQECWWIQKVSGKVWIGLEQNIVDSCGADTYCKQLKNGQLDELSAQVTEMWKKMFYVLFWLSNDAPLDKIQYLLGSVFAMWCKNRQWVRWEIKLSLDGQLCQKQSRQKLLKSDNSTLSFNRKCPGCFFPDTVV